MPNRKHNIDMNSADNDGKYRKIKLTFCDTGRLHQCPSVTSVKTTILASSGLIKLDYSCLSDDTIIHLASVTMTMLKF